MISFAEGKQFVQDVFVLETFEDVPLTKIIEILQAADDLYFNDDESFIEDSQYDALKMYAQRTAPADVYFTGVGSSVRGGKIDLPYKMGSLNQVYQGDYLRWVSQHGVASDNAVISDKLDGASVLIVYDREGALQIAYSRGDGFRGADITRHVREIHNVPTQIVNPTGAPIGIRAENIISPAAFKALMADPSRAKQLKRPYKNPRNMVSGLMNSSENPAFVYDVIDTVAYEIVGSNLSKTEQLTRLAEYGFDVVNYVVTTAGNHTDDTLTAILNEARNASKYELDGIVIDIDSSVVRARLATDELNPEYAVKFKVADASNLAEATVLEVEWNVSKDGYLKPRVCIEPVNLVGVTIQHATGFNAKFIKDNQIGPGAIIKITRSGDVIPFILETVAPSPSGPQMPDDDAEWTSTGVDLVLMDASSNDQVRFEQLVSFFDTLDVPHLGEGNLRAMFDMQFDTPEKIIPLTQEDIGSLIGSLSIAKKIFAGMRSKLQSIPMYVLMGAHPALGRGVGVRKMKKLWEAFKGDMSLCRDESRITQVEGFDKKTAAKITKGYDAFMAFFMQIEPYVTLLPFVDKPQGQLTGKVFVFTGFRSKDLESAIEAAGGTLGTGVSGKTSFLVTMDPKSTSGKAQKARDLGVQVIGIDELKGML